MRSPGLTIVVAAAALACTAVSAQQAPSPQPSPRQPPSSEWTKLPRMQLERQFAGPLQDTIIQRWRDPIDGTACYIYLPITAAHSAPTPDGFVQYGANTIGSISCMHIAAPATAATGRPLPAAH
jgi:hypothetical protein